jgi:hypothetical protein
MPPSFNRFEKSNIESKPIKQLAEQVIPEIFKDSEIQDTLIKNVQYLPPAINEQNLLHTMSADLSKALVGGNTTLSQQGDEGIERGGDGKPKSFFFDPYSFTDSLSHKNQISGLSYSTLAEMTRQCAPVGAIINTRLNQLYSFSRIPRNRYALGFRVELDDNAHKMSESDKSKAKEIEKFILGLGIGEASLQRDHVDLFFKKAGRDSMTYDQINFERVFTYVGGLHEVVSVDAASIRIALRKYLDETDPRKDVTDLQIVPDRNRGFARVNVPIEKKAYLQVVNSQIITEYTEDEMAFCTRWPRTDLKAGGYGYSEVEQLISTITAILFAGEYNRRFFSSGSSPKGILNVKGNMSQQQIDAFKRAWLSQLSGLSGAWRTPIVAVEKGLEFISTDKTNREMEFSKYQDFLIKIACAVWAIAPEEINFSSTSSATGQGAVFESKSELRLKSSRDKGLVPFLMFFENMINREIIRYINPKFRFVFVGLDGGTEADQVELSTKRTKWTTIDELRAKDDLPPLPNGVGQIVDHPGFIQLALEKMRESAQEKMLDKNQQFQTEQGDTQYNRQQEDMYRQQESQLADREYQEHQATTEQEHEDEQNKQAGQKPKPKPKSAPKKTVKKSLIEDGWDEEDQDILTNEIQNGLKTGDFTKAIEELEGHPVTINLDI